MYEIIYREMFYKGGVVMVKEKVSGVELIGWEEDELLKLKRDNGFKYLNNRRDLTAPECSISVVELTQKLEEHFRFMNPKDYLGEIVKATEKINNLFSEFYVENGLHANAPFNVAEEYEINGKKDISVMTMYPTKVNGLFIAMQTSEFRLNDDVLAVCTLDGKKMSELANNGKFKVREIEKCKVENGYVISKSVIEKTKPIDLTPDFKQGSTNKLEK